MAARTLANAHPRLSSLLEPGMAVLDVGCGPGTLTMEMAGRVWPGRVVGLDLNPRMVTMAEAGRPHGDLPNLAFRVGDVLESDWDGEFDVVSAVRTLQWIAKADAAIAAMARAVAPGGRVALVDYDHTLVRWAGEPRSWRHFYRAFLDWRADAGLDNRVAQRLSTWAHAAGLTDGELSPQVTRSRAGEPDFYRVAGAWRLIADGRGRQMVAARFLTEGEWREAVVDYTAWMQRADAAITTHEACLVARRPRISPRRRAGHTATGRVADDEVALNPAPPPRTPAPSAAWRRPRPRSRRRR